MGKSKSRGSDFRAAVRKSLGDLEIRRPTVRLLVGTDAFILQERRVALTPRHITELRDDLTALGLTPEVYVVRGAGERAGGHQGPPYLDDQYEAAGARMVSVEDTPDLPELDVVHALKEPTEYESRLPGHMIRIGALHLASKPPGVCHLAKHKNFSAIIDGATVGNCAYLQLGDGDRTPIVGSMSRFAGSLAGRKLVEGLDTNGLGEGKIVVVGGGIAGMSAIGELVHRARPLVVVDPWEPTRQRLASQLPELGHPFEITSEITEEVIEGAVGIVFAHRSGAQKAARVCDYHKHIRKMRPGAAISDIAIDQGGSIDHPDFHEEDDVVTSRDKYQKLLTPDYFYYAETNMPREEPHMASAKHGDASLPYISTLLGLCAAHGNPEQVVTRLLHREIATFTQTEQVAGLSFLQAVLQDLRNGIQLATQHGNLLITDPDIDRDTHLPAWIRKCADAS